MSKGRTQSPANTIVLMIKGSPVRVTYETVPMGNVKLDPDNPRVRLQVQRKFARKPTQENLIEIVRAQPGFPELQKAIRENNGIHDPLIVRHDYTVAEGNSRAVVIRILGTAKSSDPRWHSVPVMRLPADIAESAVASLLASYHVGGKTPWRPYAKAEHITFLRKSHGLTIDEIAQATRMAAKSVEQHIEAFEYFQNELAPGGDGDLLENKFSHALELIKGKKLASIRDDPEKRKLVTDLIRSNDLSGQDVRNIHELFASKQAVEALKKGRVGAAKKVVEKTNPSVNSKFLQKMEQLKKTLDDLLGTDIDKLKTNAAAAKILVGLHAKIVEIAAVAQIYLGERNGAPRSKRA